MTNEYKVTVPEGQLGAWRIERFEVTSEDEKLERLRAAIAYGMGGRFCPAGHYTRLTFHGEVVMSDTPDEIRDHLYAIHRAQGNCLINGLGLGVVLQGMARKAEVTHVTVIEIAPEVIKLVAPHYQAMFGDKIDIIQADALEYRPPRGARFGVVWHDIWPSICADNLDEMKQLHRRYGRLADWQGSWGREFIMR